MQNIRKLKKKNSNKKLGYTENGKISKSQKNGVKLRIPEFQLVLYTRLMTRLIYYLPIKITMSIHSSEKFTKADMKL